MQNQRIEIKQNQASTFELNFWHRQMSHMLSLSTAALSDYIKAQADRNPCLEIESDGLSFAGGDFHDFTEFIPDRSTEDFRRELELQLSMSKGDRSPLERYLISALDSRGYCREDLKELAALFSEPLEGVKNALRQIQALEPAGIGARNLRECFLLQLARKGLRGSDAWRLLREAFTPLSHGNDKAVLSQLAWTPEQLASARSVLAELHTSPIVTAEDTAAPVIPDAEIVRMENGTLEVRLFEHALPKLVVSASYLDSLSAQAPGRRFAQDGIFYARRFIYCLEQRNKTMLQTLQFAVERQSDYLCGGKRQICRLKDAAEKLGVHPSTITHAVSGKYVVFGRRVLTVRELFARECVAGYSVDQLEKLILSAVETEDKRNPYSDQKLTDKINKELGVCVARRTIAKYRSQLGIAAAKERIAE